MASVLTLIISSSLLKVVVAGCTLISAIYLTLQIIPVSRALAVIAKHGCLRQRCVLSSLLAYKEGSPPPPRPEHLQAIYFFSVPKIKQASELLATVVSLLTEPQDSKGRGSRSSLGSRFSSKTMREQVPDDTRQWLRENGMLVSLSLSVCVCMCVCLLVFVCVCVCVCVCV